MNQTAPGAGHVPRRHEFREQFWRATFRRFAASGQSVRAFCEAHALAKQSFYSWRRRLAGREAALTSEASGTSTPAFVPVHLAAENSGVMEIVLRSDRRIRLCGPVDRSALAEVVAALESLPAQDSQQ